MLTNVQKRKVAQLWKQMTPQQRQKFFFNDFLTFRQWEKMSNEQKEKVYTVALENYKTHVVLTEIKRFKQTLKQILKQRGF